MDGVTWITCPVCDWYFKPGLYEDPICRCGYEMSPEEVEQYSD